MYQCLISVWDRTLGWRFCGKPASDKWGEIPVCIDCYGALRRYYKLDEVPNSFTSMHQCPHCHREIFERYCSVCFPDECAWMPTEYPKPSPDQLHKLAEILGLNRNYQNTVLPE